MSNAPQEQGARRQPPVNEAPYTNKRYEECSQQLKAKAFCDRLGVPKEARISEVCAAHSKIRDVFEQAREKGFKAAYINNIRDLEYATSKLLLKITGGDILERLEVRLPSSQAEIRAALASKMTDLKMLKFVGAEARDRLREVEENLKAAADILLSLPNFGSRSTPIATDTSKLKPKRAASIRKEAPPHPKPAPVRVRPVPKSPAPRTSPPKTTPVPPKTTTPAPPREPKRVTGTPQRKRFIPEKLPDVAATIRPTVTPPSSPAPKKTPATLTPASTLKTHPSVSSAPSAVKPLEPKRRTWWRMGALTALVAGAAGAMTCEKELGIEKYTEPAKECFHTCRLEAQKFGESLWKHAAEFFRELKRDEPRSSTPSQKDLAPSPKIEAAQKETEPGQQPSRRKEPLPKLVAGGDLDKVFGEILDEALDSRRHRELARTLYDYAALSPTPVKAFRELGDRFADKPKSIKLRLILSGYRRLSGDNPESLFHVGEAFQHGGQLDRAEDFYHRYLRKVPDADGALNQLALVHYKRGEFEKSVEYLERAVQLNPNSELLKSNFEKAKFLAIEKPKSEGE